MENSLLRYESVLRRRLAKEDEEEEDEESATEESSCTIKIQTDMTLSDLSGLESECQERLDETVKLKQQVNESISYPTEAGLKDDKNLLVFYTGLTSITVFTAIFQLVAPTVPHSKNRKLSNFQCFLMTLIKIRLNLSNYDLGFRFCVSEATVGRIFQKWIAAMDTCLSPIILWPEREAVEKTMPYCFQRNYGLRVVSIIDCFKLFIEKPSNLLAKSCTWSSYKHYNTAKYLISITPQGTISFISKGWGGRVSDKYITEHSGYLNKLSPGDMVLADRGFNVDDSIAITGARLAIPAFTRGRDQLSAAEIESTRKLANVRIHVERVIGALRQRFSILSATGVPSKDIVQTKINDDNVLLDAVVRVCCAMNNLCEGVVPF